MAWICRFFCDFCETQIQKLKIKESGRQKKHSRKGIWHQKEWWLLCPQRGNLGESMWIEILPRGKCKSSDWTSSTIYHENYVHPDLSLLWSLTSFKSFLFSLPVKVVSNLVLSVLCTRNSIIISLSSFILVNCIRII